MIHRAVNYSLFVFAISITIMWLAALVGTTLHRRWPLPEEEREDFGLVVTASLTLLGLIIGFAGRVDQVVAKEPARIPWWPGRTFLARNNSGP